MQDGDADVAGGVDWWDGGLCVSWRVLGRVEEVWGEGEGYRWGGISMFGMSFWVVDGGIRVGR